MSFDLLLDQSTNDLMFYNNDLVFTISTPLEVSQRVAMLLKTFEGEWFLDTTYGIPYRQEIINQARTQAEVDSIFVAAISAVDGVDSIEDFTSTFDKPTRTYTAVASVNTTAGTIVVPVSTSPSEKYIYPTPASDGPTVSCDVVDVTEYVNKLFYYVNYTGLPSTTGEDTWTNNWSSTN